VLLACFINGPSGPIVPAGYDGYDHTLAVKMKCEECGRKHALDVARSLNGRVASLKILELPGLAVKGDVSDWLAAGGKRQDLEAFTLSAPEYESEQTDDAATMRFTTLRDLLSEQEQVTAWVVENLLPSGGDSLLVAKPKVGKSTLARCLALAVARGNEFLGRKTSQGLVMYLALEEKRDEVRRHFEAMGGRDEPDPDFLCPVAGGWTGPTTDCGREV
jgi:hypothetical protein